MTDIEAKIILDSVSDSGDRLTTYQLRYPRFIHSELLTHRVFSRVASSSRAIPVAKSIQEVLDNPVIPLHWGLNKAGMQASEEICEAAQDAALKAWLDAAKAAADYAGFLAGINVHKQVTNRLLEPFLRISVVLSGTTFNNFFKLRDHKAAQPEIQELAHQMRLAYQTSKPRLLSEGEWHTPYIKIDEARSLSQEDTLLVSAARCARTSFMNHDRSNPVVEKDLKLAETLIADAHLSPTEHQATPSKGQHGNFHGWKQFRKTIKGESGEAPAGPDWWGD